MRGAVIIGFLALAACAPTVPDSGSGVGFGRPDEFLAAQAARDAALRRSISQDGVTNVPSPPPPTANDPALGDTAAAAATAPEATDRAPTGISDEQNFDAVSERETIESDAARIAANRAAFEVVAPTALPSRTGAGPNIVEYALRTTNSVGQSLYRRSGLSNRNRHLRNCAEFPSADIAQQTFLAAGGPERDRRNLDPDGDGFACAWDPAPFRVVGN
ncbi:MAG: hypothetical protein AAFQ54_03220 [Pseudomonadota bacterium]